jgi:hypothetical protein
VQKEADEAKNELIFLRQKYTEEAARREKVAAMGKLKYLIF